MSKSRPLPEIDPGAPHVAALARLTTLAREQLPPPDAAPEAAAASVGYRRLRQALAGAGQEKGRVRREPRRWLVPAMTGALVAVLAGGAAWWLRPAPLTFTAERETAVEGGYLAAPPDAEAALRFSDGSRVVLAPSSRTRVAATSARGARVTLDHGSANVSVVPRAGGQWTFDAGPCVVRVTGTRFTMRWSSAEQVLEVSLSSGSVTVLGPPAPSGLVMRSGQHLVMDVRRGVSRLEQAPPPAAPLPAAAEVRPGTLSEPASAIATPAEGPAAAAEPAPVLSPVPAPSTTRGSRGGDSWSAQVLAGDFAAVLQAARRRGVDGVLAQSGAADVMALAQAARLSHEPALARRALQAARRRFPATPEARKAAFLLGRMAEDQDGDLTRALQWYGTYLSDAPAGTYADEALGRQMTATHRLHGAARARPVAEEYLRRFPGGGYAEAARGIVKAAP